MGPFGKGSLQEQFCRVFAPFPDAIKSICLQISAEVPPVAWCNVAKESLEASF